MRLARVEVGGVDTIGIQHADGKIYDLRQLMLAASAAQGVEAEIPATILDAALAGARLNDAFLAAFAYLDRRGLANRFAVPTTLSPLAPLPRPNRILAIGRNYAKHAQEQGREVTEEPVVFLKASTCVIGPGAPIRIPAWLGRVDYEAELLVILGRGGRYVSEADAMSLVAGYSVFNDVTARDVQRGDQEAKHPWFRSKSLDTFGPMGPFIVTPDEVPDPHNLRLSLTLNGVTKQDDTTGSMVFRIPYLIAYLSRWFALEPGDVIATGTPSGIGPIVPGDTVSATVEGIGTLTNPVAGEE